MASQERRPPFGDLPAVDPQAAIRYHLHIRHVGPHADPGAGRDQGLGVDRRDVGLRLLGVRHPFLGHRPVRLLLRNVHRVLGRALLLREDRRARAPDRELHHRCAREDDPRDGRHHGLLDAHLCASAVAGGARDRASTWRRIEQGQQADSFGRAGGLDPRRQAAARAGVGREGRRYGRHDRDRHDHHVRVQPSARRHAHHRGPLHRGDADARRRRAGGVRRAGRARGHVVRARVDSARPVPDEGPGREGACTRPARAGGRGTSTTGASAGAGTT